MTYGLLQVVGINKDADSLAEAYPDAVDHILAKRREMLRAVDKLDGLVRARDTQLEQNEQLLEYLATFRSVLQHSTISLFKYVHRLCVYH